MAVASVAGVFAEARTENPIVDRVLAALVLTATAYTLVRVLRWWAARYVITGERVMVMSGVVSVRVSSIPLSKINDTTFTRSWAGRFLGYGDLMLESAGERAGLSRLGFVPKPRDAYRLLTSLVNETARPARPAGPERRRPAPGIPGPDDTGPLPRFS